MDMKLKWERRAYGDEEPRSLVNTLDVCQEDLFFSHSGVESIRWSIRLLISQVAIASYGMGGLP